MRAFEALLKKMFLCREMVELEKSLDAVSIPASSRMEARSLEGAPARALEDFLAKTGGALQRPFKPLGHGFGCYKGEELIGWQWAFPNGSQAAHARDLFVLPEHRASSLGRVNAWLLLTRAFCGHLRERGFRTISAEVPAGDAVRLKLHIKEGYRVKRYVYRITAAGLGPWTVPGTGMAGKLIERIKGLKSRLKFRWAFCLFPEARLLEGLFPGTSDRFKVLHLGEPEPFNYFADRMYEGLPASRSLGRRPFWSWRSLMRSEKADMLYAELPAPLAKWLSRRLGYCLPELIDGVLDLRDKAFVEGRKMFRHSRDAMEERGWTGKTSEDLDDFYRFYHFYYLPTVGKKFFNYRHVLAFDTMRTLFKSGFLVQLCQGGEVAASMLAVRLKGTLWVAYVGVRGGSPGLAEGGAVAACYYLSVRHALDNGFSAVDFGPCRPFLDDGVYQHKRRWGVAVSSNPRTHGSYWFLPDTRRPNVRRFLLRAPFTVEKGQGLEAMCFYDSPGQDRKAWVETCDKHFISPGMRRVHHIPLLSPSVASEGFSLKAKPPALWPQVSGPVLRRLGALRSRLHGRDYDEFYRESPYLSAQEIKRYQESKLRGLLAHAQKTVPAFGRLDGVLAPGDFSWEAFRRIPLMDRQGMAIDPAAFRSSHPFPATAHAASSGTTSHPVTLTVDGESIFRRDAVHWRGRGWWGFKRGDRYAKIWGRLAPLNWRRKVLERGLENAVVFNSYILSDDEMERCYRKLSGSSFRYVYGYASAVLETAQHWRERGWSLPPGWVEGAFITADMISPAEEKTIEQAFGCPVIREYGATEFNQIGLECPQGSLHLDSDRLLVEFLNDQDRPVRANETGRIVITDLDNMATPFIRYPIGDLGSYSEKPCSCGRKFPVLRQLVGRENAFLELPRGGRAHSVCLSDAVEDAHIALKLACLPWTIHQTAADTLEVTLTERSRSAALEEAIKNKLWLIDPGFKAAFHYKVSLPRTAGGKRARFTSAIKKDAPAAAKAEARAGAL